MVNVVVGSQSRLVLHVGEVGDQAYLVCTTARTNDDWYPFILTVVCRIFDPITVSKFLKKTYVPST